jgi:hypothetical protein
VVLDDYMGNETLKKSLPLRALGQWETVFFSSVQ